MLGSAARIPNDTDPSFSSNPEMTLYLAANAEATVYTTLQRDGFQNTAVTDRAKSASYTEGKSSGTAADDLAEMNTPDPQLGMIQGAGAARLQQISALQGSLKQLRVRYNLIKLTATNGACYLDVPPSCRLVQI